MAENTKSTPKLGDVSFRDKIISVIVLVIFFMTVWFMMDFVVLTFILTFIFNWALNLAKKVLSHTPLRRLPDGVVLVVVFIVGLALLALCSIAFVPILIGQTQDIAQTFINFDFNSVYESLDPRIANLLDDMNLGQYLDKAGELILSWVMNIGSFSLNVLLAIAVSFVLLLEKKEISKIAKAAENSRISFVFHYFMLFGTNFCHTFGKVMKVQVTIALVNTVLSVGFLAILGFKNIIWGLGVMIFVLGLIPVAGVVISCIPLSIIAFNIGGFVKVIQVLVMVIVIHAIEAYILNPKLMATRTKLPVSFVFIILIVAQQYLGVWGLLIGVPIFIFLMSIFGVEYGQDKDKKEPILRKRISDRMKKKRARRNA